jgi:DNA-binding response OmpR family regulator
MTKQGDAGPDRGDQPLRALLVDDEQDYVQALAKRLRLRGFEPEVAYDGEQAVAMAVERPFDVVVLDIRMPRRDGIAALRDLRRFRPDLPVLLLTGHASVESGIEGMRLGAFDYLTKPVNTDELVERLRAACARAPGG